MAKLMKKVLCNLLIVSLLLGIAYVPKQAQAAAPSNETMAGATPIEPGVNASCTFNEKGNEAHYFKYTVPQNIGNQWITFTATNYTNGDLYAELLDSQGKTLIESDCIDINRTCTLETRTDGADTWLSEKSILFPGKTYYLKVYRRWGRKGNISVTVETGKDDNWGTYDKAPSVAVGKWTSGKLERLDDIDCFAVKLPNNNRKYTFNIASDNGIKASFVNGNRVLLSEVTVDANKTNNSYVTTGKGQTIYIRIQRANDKVTRANYSLKVSIQKKTISKLSLRKYKRKTKKIIGTTIGNATVKVKVSKRTYTVKSGKTGKFTVKLKKKLKSKDKIKISVSKAEYKTRTKTYVVK